MGNLYHSYPWVSNNRRLNPISPCFCCGKNPIRRAPFHLPWTIYNHAHSCSAPWNPVVWWRSQGTILLVKLLGFSEPQFHRPKEGILMVSGNHSSWFKICCDMDHSPFLAGSFLGFWKSRTYLNMLGSGVLRNWHSKSKIPDQPMNIWRHPMATSRRHGGSRFLQNHRPISHPPGMFFFFNRKHINEYPWRSGFLPQIIGISTYWVQFLILGCNKAFGPMLVHDFFSSAPHPPSPKLSLLNRLWPQYITISGV